VIALPADVAAAALGVERVAFEITGISTDTRSLRPGDLFVALRGERFDGHAFVPAAFAAGAAGAVVQLGASMVEGPWLEAANGDARLYRVPDTIEALGSLARAVRRASSATVVAVTGSVGKTGTKDLISAMGARVRRVAATAANENNEIGVPLTLLGISRETELVVVEMGMRGFGQIEALAAVAEPDVGVVTKVAPVHLELVGSVDGVAAAKAELIRGLGPSGVAVVPAGEERLEAAVRDAGCQAVRFSYGRSSGKADVWGEGTPVGSEGSLLTLGWPEGHLQVEVPFSGRHRLENAVAATAACYAARLPLEQCAGGLRDVRFTPLRGDEHEVDGILILDHSYNANPAATVTALADLQERARRRGGNAVAILGDMLELGGEAGSYHRDVGAEAAALGVDGLIGVGPLSRATVDAFVESGGGWATWVQASADAEAFLPELMLKLRVGDVILVKGSRGIGLERTVAGLLGAYRQAGSR
jgi:UDP-N-acetylmuramoyl-tripeptide--D-alanyl-D-alanine ligase